ncbi:hypothetical protein SCG7109_BE_00050 [Chlamydiales bacterium SCGC AG-110-M15]|nr:hypothetical protein SCG7109_BE_00050 [Chlamydiales bacterium SCGC AG-110-M15]
MKCSKLTLVYLSAALWLGVGCMLLSIGSRLILEILSHHQDLNVLSLSFLPSISPSLGLYPSIYLLITLALIIGFAKGRFVLSKSVTRQVNRISSLNEPVHIGQIYNKAYYLLFALMIGLGFMMRVMNVPVDLRAFVDIAIGTALLQGAFAYLRSRSAFTS